MCWLMAYKLAIILLMKKNKGNKIIRYVSEQCLLALSSPLHKTLNAADWKLPLIDMNARFPETPSHQASPNFP